MKGGVYNYVKYISDIKTPVATPHSKSMTLQSSRRVSPTYRLRRRSNPQVRASEIGHYANMDRGTIGNTHDQSASVDEERSREARDDRKSFHSGLYAMTMPLRRGKRIENTAQRRHGCPVRCDAPSSERRSHASNLTASRGLNIVINKKANRQN